MQNQCGKSNFRSEKEGKLTSQKRWGVTEAFHYYQVDGSFLANQGETAEGLSLWKIARFFLFGSTNFYGTKESDRATARVILLKGKVGIYQVPSVIDWMIPL